MDKTFSSVIGAAVNKYATAFNLRADIVTCIVLQESGGNPFACRFEHKFYNDHLKGKTRAQLAGWVPEVGSVPTLTTELISRATSYGVMQVLGDTARWCGKVTSPYLTVMCDIDKGVEIGCRVLSYYLNKSNGNYTEALRRYNGGAAYPGEILERLRRQEHVEFLR